MNTNATDSTPKSKNKFLMKVVGIGMATVLIFGIGFATIVGASNDGNDNDGAEVAHDEDSDNDEDSEEAHDEGSDK